MKELMLVLKYVPLGFSALLPVINPIGSAVIFLGLVRYADHPTRKTLARLIAFNTVWFLVIVQITGAYVLRFFGISLPVVQVAGGLVLASMGWSLLNKADPPAGASNAAEASAQSVESLRDEIFYPLTFPLTAGPGCIVVALTLSAHAAGRVAYETWLAHLGLFIAAVLIGITVYFSYAYADRTAAKLSPGVTNGILRVISFILVCIGVEIMWNGVRALLKTLS